MKSNRFFPAIYEVFQLQKFAPNFCFCRRRNVDNLNFPPRNISKLFHKQSVKNKTKLQFFFIRLKKRFNLKPEWNKMTERSSMLKKIVHISSENIFLDLKLTSELIGRSDYRDESNSFLFKLKWKVRFLSRRSEQAQKFVKFLEETLIIFYNAVLDFFRVW